MEDGVLNELEIMKNFAANLRARRKALHLTQKEFGDLIGYSEKTVSKWESAAAVAPSVVLPLLASLLKVTVDDLFRESNTPVYYLGIHGSGRFTEFVLTDLSGKVLNRAVLEECNPVDVGVARTVEVLEEGIYKVCAGYQLSEVSVYAGMAGGLSGDHRERIAAFLKRCGFVSYGNGGSIDIALPWLGDGDGVLVIVGTGSIAYVRTGSELRRIGGYGYMFGDGGSAHGLGRAAIQYALEAEACGNEDSILLQKVRELCDTPRVEDALKRFYTGSKSFISSFAPLVFDAYRAGDVDAEYIMRDAAANIAKLIIRGQECFNGKHVPIMITGGFIKRDSVLLSMIEEALPRQYVSRLSVNERPLVWGALQMAGLPEACIRSDMI